MKKLTHWLTVDTIFRIFLWYQLNTWIAFKELFYSCLNLLDKAVIKAYFICNIVKLYVQRRFQKFKLWNTGYNIKLKKIAHFGYRDQAFKINNIHRTVTISRYISYTAMRPLQISTLLSLTRLCAPFKYQPFFLLHGHAPHLNINPFFSYTAMRPLQISTLLSLTRLCAPSNTNPSFSYTDMHPPSNTKPTFSYTAMRPFKYQPCFLLQLSTTKVAENKFNLFDCVFDNNINKINLTYLK